MDLNKLSLVELKYKLKNAQLPITGNRSDLIKRLHLHFEIPKPTVNRHSDKITNEDKKIIGLTFEDTSYFIQISKQIENKTARFMYFSMGVFYYEVKKEFNFL